MTWGTPPTTPTAGDDHCPCRIFSPGELSVHSTSPVFLSIARKLGHLSAERLICDSSTPFEVYDEEHVAQGGDRATAHVVLRHAQFRHHVKDPDPVGFVLILKRDLLHGLQIGSHAIDAYGAGTVVRLGNHGPGSVRLIDCHARRRL